MNHERLLSNHVSRSVNERIQDKPRSYVVDGDSTGIPSKREVVLLSTHPKANVQPRSVTNFSPDFRSLL